MDSTPLYNFPYPEVDDAADASAQLEALAMAVEAAYTDTTFQTYTPSWTTTGTGAVQPSGATTQVGYYRVANGWCDLSIYFIFGPSTNGGRMYYNIGLPVEPTVDIEQQTLVGKLWVPSVGPFPSLLVCSGGSLSALPMCPNTLTDPQMIVWQSTDAAGTAGTGRPQIAGTHIVQNGGHIGWTGRYRV